MAREKPKAHFGAIEWTVPIGLATKPRCPGCGDRLSPIATYFIWSTAVCTLCSNMPDELVREKLGIMYRVQMQMHVRHARGLWFWCPEPHVSQEYTPWLVYERIKAAEDALGRTIGRPRKLTTPIGSNNQATT